MYIYIERERETDMRPRKTTIECRSIRNAILEVPKTHRKIAIINDENSENFDYSRMVRPVNSRSIRLGEGGKDRCRIAPIVLVKDRLVNHYCRSLLTAAVRLKENAPLTSSKVFAYYITCTVPPDVHVYRQLSIEFEELLLERGYDVTSADTRVRMSNSIVERSSECAFNQSTWALLISPRGDDIKRPLAIRRFIEKLCFTRILPPEADMTLDNYVRVTYFDWMDNPSSTSSLPPPALSTPPVSTHDKEEPEEDEEADMMIESLSDEDEEWVRVYAHPKGYVHQPITSVYRWNGISSKHTTSSSDKHNGSYWYNPDDPTPNTRHVPTPDASDDELDDMFFPSVVRPQEVVAPIEIDPYQAYYAAEVQRAKERDESAKKNAADKRNARRRENASKARRSSHP
jgi:hypothetical protein